MNHFSQQLNMSHISQCKPLGLQPIWALAVVTGLVVLTFVPILCVHPFRVVRLRILTVIVALVWGAAAAIAVANTFPSAPWVKVALLVSAAYFTAVGVGRSLRHVMP